MAYVKKKILHLLTNMLKLYELLISVIIMGNNKEKTDNTLKMLGFHYQYLIIVEHALSASDDDTIYIENRGDLAKNKEIIEIKHHNDPNYILDKNHIDFWKTLSNFKDKLIDIKEYEYKKIVLLTTAIIKKDCPFYNWNDLEKGEKFRKLKSIKKHAPQAISKYVDNIFSFNEKYLQEDLLFLLDKFIINDSHEDFNKKINSLCKHFSLKVIEESKRKSFLLDFFGFIISKLNTKDGSWFFRMAEFNNYFRSHATKYINNLRPLPTLTSEENTYNPQKYSSRPFVQELRNIKIKRIEIESAVSDYHRYNSISIKLAGADIIFNDILKNYYTKIKDSLKDIKQIIVLDCNCSSDLIKMSQKVFLKSKMMPLKNIEGITINEEFFQRGSMHQIVDDNEHIWQIKDDEI